MKKTTLYVEKTDYYCNVFGFRRTRIVGSEEIYLSPETIEEEQLFYRTYRAARKRGLPRLREIDKTISLIDISIDDVNKSSIGLLRTWTDIRTFMIKKDGLSKLMTYIDNLSSIVAHPAPSFPMHEGVYACVNEFDHYITVAETSLIDVCHDISASAKRLISYVSKV